MIADTTAEYLKKMCTRNLKPPPKFIIQNRIFLGACEKVSLASSYRMKCTFIRRTWFLCSPLQMVHEHRLQYFGASKFTTGCGCSSSHPCYLVTLYDVTVLLSISPALNLAPINAIMTPEISILQMITMLKTTNRISMKVTIWLIYG